MAIVEKVFEGNIDPNELNAKMELDLFVRQRLEQLNIFSDELFSCVLAYDTARVDGFRHTTTLCVAGTVFLANQIRKIDAEIDTARSALIFFRDNQSNFDKGALRIHQGRMQVTFQQTVLLCATVVVK
jgi:hypothetical protein